MLETLQLLPTGRNTRRRPKGILIGLLSQ